MARLTFGGGIADWTMTIDGTNSVFTSGNIVVTFWDSRTGGNRYTDLQDTSGSAVTSVTSSTGADGQSIGQIPNFLGPDGVFELWAQAGSGPRALMTAINLGSYLGPVRSQLDAHLSPGVVNPHLTTLSSLVDVNGASAGTVGQLLGTDGTGLWAPVTVVGVGGTVNVTGNQTVAGTKTLSEPATPGASRLVVNAAEGQTADLLQAYSSTAAGQGGVRIKTVALSPTGELRATAAKSDTVPVRVTGQPSQTANLFEQLNSAGTTLSRMQADGSWRAPNLGRSIMFQKAGTLTAGAILTTWTNDTGVSLSIRSVRAVVRTAPTGASVLVDVNINGTTIYTTQANRPTVLAAGTNSGKSTGFSLSTIPDGAALTVDIDQIGSTVAGADLTVQVDVW
jgi:hypothetical protein